MKVLGLASYPIEAAATRYRLEQFVAPLAERGITLTVRPFLDSRLFERLYQKGDLSFKAYGLLKSVLRRLKDLLALSEVDLVFVQREAMLVGPPLIEWLATHILHCPMVLDLDDATYTSYISPTYGKLGKTLKWFGKTDRLIRWATLVTCGNQAIAEYVAAKGKRAVIIPTVVDTDQFRPRVESPANSVPVLGWIGTHSTYQYMVSIFPALQRLARQYRFRLKVIGAGREEVAIPDVDVENLPWSLAREIEDFQSFDIGLYPIIEDDWSVGKSGFKSVQYMAVGVPFVTTPVGASAKLGEPNVTHFFASTEDEWCEALAQLITDESLRRRMGAAGRRHAVEHYAVAPQAQKLADLFHATMRT